MSFRVPDQLLLPWSPRYTVSATRAAEILDVSHDTISRMCEDGTLKAYKVRPDKPSSPWRISYDSLLAYVEKLHERNGLEKRF
jgi:excisionase family DNA binding protein